jgi:hypothetical protein
MRTTSLVPVLAALISIASTFPIGFSAHHGGVAARDPARVRSPATPPNLVARAKPSPERRHLVPRQAPSPKHDGRDHIPRAAPSARHDRRDYVPRAALSARQSTPSDVHHNQVQPGHTKRSPQDQNVLGNKIEDGVGWDNDQCPAPLSACPVRGASDVDAIECVDLYSDLYSCGGCAADDIACVSFFETPILFSYSVFLAMIAMKFPMHAASSVSLVPAKYTRALMGTSLRLRMTYVYLSGPHGKTVWCHCLSRKVEWSCLLR